jgi:hypothetical protein
VNKSGCDGQTHRLATDILTDMGMEVAPSLAFFRAHGGWCDCEVLLNVGDWIENGILA